MVMMPKHAFPAREPCQIMIHQKMEILRCFIKRYIFNHTMVNMVIQQNMCLAFYSVLTVVISGWEIAGIP